ncbi:hypothetical protein [Burkholderia cepacia]|uniref:hypothetical protein n=1 Tax=Burkholderia cepacia TaxID=292 RepID=UPI0021AB7389|nr:hypothetical protein [Burkholderia cepacia]
MSSNPQAGAILPPNCAKTTGGCGTAAGAPDDGTYPYVWNNGRYDGSFGITSRIFLDQITPAGVVVGTLEVPNSLQKGFAHDQMVTSFSSKSELGLHLSLDGSYLTFMGYVAPVNAIDVSNSKTPLAVDTTDPDEQNFYRVIARVDCHGHFRFTETNAYSGNNGRADDGGPAEVGLRRGRDAVEARVYAAERVEPRAAGDGLPWAPATAGLRNLMGRVERDGTVTIWAITSTVSVNDDVGADPNRLVAVRDVLKSTSATTAAHEQFAVLRTAKFAEVLRGIEFAPGTETGRSH